MNKFTTQLYSGVMFDPFEPDPDKIFIEDIAHALSLLCRWGGHSNRFYSVGEHSLHVSSLCSSEYALEGLMHDATEAYMVDIPRPIKHRLPDYKAAEDRLYEVIAKKFGLKALNQEVHAADTDMLYAEAQFLLRKGEDESWKKQSSEKASKCMKWSNEGLPDPSYIESMFLSRFQRLYRLRNK